MQNYDEQNEVTFLDYWEVITRKKFLFLGLFIFCMLFTVIINFISPKIYRGEYLLKMATNNYTDLIIKINSNDKKNLKKILPKSNESLTNIKLTPLIDSTINNLRIYKLKIQIDAQDTSIIPVILSEFVNYLNDFPYFKKSISDEKEIIEFQSNEMNKAIDTLDKKIKQYDLSLKNNKIKIPELNFIELNNQLINLKTKKLISEQSLRNFKGIEIITHDISSNPVKPDIKGNFIEGIIAFILTAMIIIFFIYNPTRK